MCKNKMIWNEDGEKIKVTSDLKVSFIVFGNYNQNIHWTYIVKDEFWGLKLIQVTK